VPFVVSLLACFKLRAVPVNVNYRYVAIEMKEIFDDSQAVALVVDDDLVEECALALAGSPDPRHVVVIGSDVGPLGDRAVTYDGALAAPHRLVTSGPARATTSTPSPSRRAAGVEELDVVAERGPKSRAGEEPASAPS